MSSTTAEPFHLIGFLACSEFENTQLLSDNPEKTAQSFPYVCRNTDLKLDTKPHSKIVFRFRHFRDHG
jgi:hypothetical protein